MNYPLKQSRATKHIVCVVSYLMGDSRVCGTEGAPLSLPSDDASTGRDYELQPAFRDLGHTFYFGRQHDKEGC